MSYYGRLMYEADIAQVAEIDQESFPDMWPPANFKRELQTRLAHYIVADLVNTATGQAVPAKPPTSQQYLAGFAGFWILADEAHVTNIAVRHAHRRRGIGEFLLICLINLAQELNARVLALEVRASNAAAQGLYNKYGFDQVTVRQRYYTNNQENAIVMVTGDITASAFQKHLSRLKSAHSRRWGIARYDITR